DRLGQRKLELFVIEADGALADSSRLRVTKAPALLSSSLDVRFSATSHSGFRLAGRHHNSVLALDQGAAPTLHAYALGDRRAGRSRLGHGARSFLRRGGGNACSLPIVRGSDDLVADASCCGGEARTQVWMGQ